MYNTGGTRNKKEDKKKVRKGMKKVREAYKTAKQDLKAKKKQHIQNVKTAKQKAKKQWR